MARRVRTDRGEKKPRSALADPRLAVGIVLVLASVAGVAGVVLAADDSAAVWSARAALLPGDRIEEGDLELRQVRLGASAGLYLPAGSIPTRGAVVVRPIGAGELVPRAALGAVEGEQLASLVVGSSGALSASITDGSIVDLWASRATEEGLFGPPAVLVSKATVVRVRESNSLIAGDTEVDVEILVPREKTALVLEALANNEALSFVPSTAPMGD